MQCLLPNKVVAPVMPDREGATHQRQSNSLANIQRHTMFETDDVDDSGF